MGQVLRVGVIVLPLVMFLAIFGQDIIARFTGAAEGTVEEADTLADDATTTGFE